ncbi:MAG: DUF898 family protein [Proteobacteria bacterium]|nr:DUF898 family protein [Pseudomonadota bacterium]
MQPDIQQDQSSTQEFYRFQFFGQGMDFFVIMLKNIILTIFTLGIYHFWAKVNSRKFLWQNMEFASSRFLYTGTAIELLIARLKFFGIVAVAVLIVALISMGGLGETVGMLVGGLIYFAFFLCVPYLIIGAWRYRLSRTTWKGIQLGMMDCGKEYTMSFIGGYILTILSFGLYYSKWSHDLYRIPCENIRMGTLRFKYTGKPWDLLVPCIKAFFLTIFTLGFYIPWFVAEMARYRASHTFIGSETNGFARMQCKLTGGQILGQVLLQYLLIVFTFGLALPWVIINNLNFFCENIFFQGKLDFSNIQQSNLARPGALADGIGDALDIGIG